MIPVHQSKPSAPPSGNQPTTNKTAFGLPAVFLGLVLSFGLVGNVALGSCVVCDEQILGKEYCDGLRATCERYKERREDVLQQVDNYGWDVCNKSSNTIHAAYASAYEGYGYTRKGWYEVSPGSCRRILAESMTDKNYYVSILKSDGSTWTRQEKSFCMWLPQSDKQIYQASYSTCRKWKMGNMSFQRMERANGWITTVD